MCVDIGENDRLGESFAFPVDHRTIRIPLQGGWALPRLVPPGGLRGNLSYSGNLFQILGSPYIRYTLELLKDLAWLTSLGKGRDVQSLQIETQSEQQGLADLHVQRTARCMSRELAFC
jgi:hypothetical protein